MTDPPMILWVLREPDRPEYLRVQVCEVCGALVAAPALARHEAWHGEAPR